MPRSASKLLFITWSGPLSQLVALALREWLRLLFPTLEFFVSTEDLRKGANWSTDLSKSLTRAYRGIACITTDNFEKPWLHFEIGALFAASKGIGVYSLIVDSLQDSMLAGNPISQFQHTRLIKADFSSAPGSDMDSAIWKPSAPSMVGAIGVSRCTFRKCTFENIGFTGSEATIEMMRRLTKRH